MGVHFHLDGYDAEARVAALGESLDLIDALRARGHDPRFIDIGGGIPMSYLDSPDQWRAFWGQHRREPVTFEGHPLANVYPYHQAPVRGEWLDRVLAPVARELAARGLRCAANPGDHSWTAAA